MSGLPGLGYYGQPYQPPDPRRPIDDYAQARSLPVIGNGSIVNGMTNGGQSLDEIIHQNNLEMMRRRTYQQPPFRQPSPENHVRRASMLEFGAPMSDDLADFQFDPNPATSILPNPIGDIAATQKSLDPRKVRSRENLNVNTRFPPLDSTYGPYPNTSSYSPALMSGVSMNLDAQYMPQNMDLSMDYENASADLTPMSLHPSTNQQSLFTDSPLSQNFPPTYPGPIQDPGVVDRGSDEQTLMERVSHMNMPDSIHSEPVRRDIPTPGPVPTSQVQNITGMGSPVRSHQKARRISTSEQRSNDNNFNTSEELTTSRPSKFSNAYSSSGFDMLGVLIKVAQRPNPEINIGPVDMSCAFVVCDITKHDLPIVYCSDVFERLTGYSRSEILGRNCRFLQAPDGKVQAGVKRKYVDNSSVLILKNKINKRSEVQLSIINYRKGGQPFMNLLTMIPVTWDTDEYRYYVGFQVDLVEQPSSVQAKNPNGSYAINYQRGGQFPRYVLQAPDTTLQADMGQTIGRDEVSTVLSTIGAGESDLSKRIWDKVLLENTDDVVHVLSLKGLFLYLSPASRKVLEYDASELVGTALSSVCHPSDIVPVTRELKDTSSGAAVNVVFRIRRKHSGYTWFESHGCLHTEQGKGRKCIILVGRQRPVFALARSEIASDGGIGENELWTKMSTSGMFLYVSSNARTLLDRTPEDLIGTSIQALMRPDSKKEFSSILEVARTGLKQTVKHDIQTRRGQVLQAQTTIFPGDAEPGQKPTFFVGQTKFVKMTRAALLSQKPEVAASPRTDRVSVGSVASSTQISGASGKQALSRSSSTNQPLHSVSQDSTASFITTAGMDGLIIGNQDEALASEDNIFDELKTTRSTSWQFELRQMEKQNRLLAEELAALQSRKKKRKRRKGMGQMEKDCANCHTRVTPEWRRGPSGNRDLCNSCGLRWAKQVGRVSPRKYSDRSDKQSASSPIHPADMNADNKTSGQSTSVPPSGGAQLASLKPKRESPGSPRGSMPAKIDEGQEPPHETVLPA